MSTVENLYATSWELRTSITIDAPTDRVYGMVSDITRMGEWSPECVGGTWIAGTPGAVGARFHGFNSEGPAVWSSECEVLTAEEPRTFGFSVLRFTKGRPSEDSEWVGGLKPGDVTWTFHLEETPTGCVLTQVHSMGYVNPFFQEILEEADESERAARVQARKEHLQHSMESTLQQVKVAAEKQG
ncbi:SRPBCC family protein [Actinosynnema sp. NPDC091369]